MPSATENNGKHLDRDEAIRLAPWYVAGTLEDSEAEELDELFAEDREFAKSVAEARRESQAATFVNEALGRPSPDLWARIEQSAVQERRAQQRMALIQRVHTLKSSLSRAFQDFAAPQWQAVAAIALGVCVVQAAAIVYLSGAGGTAPAYRTASGQPAATRANVSAFIVSFQDNAAMADIGKALDEAGAVIVDGPNADMLYHLGLRRDTIEARAQVYAKLQSSGLVSSILPEK